MSPVPEHIRAYYYALRTLSRQRVANAFVERFRRDGGIDNWNRITLASIDQDALDYARLEWPKHYAETTHEGFRHSWEAIYHHYRRYPQFYDLSIWQLIDGKRVLQGLAVGKPSRGKTHLTVNWVERSFAPTYLRGGILLPILACAEEYAKLLGCKRVLLKDAVDPEKYGRYGYAPYNLGKNAAGEYLGKEL